MAENEAAQKEADYQFWETCAKVTSLARNLANTRGSVATPEYMEQQVWDIVKGSGLEKNVRVIKGQELVEKGMNLIYNVGKAA